MNVRVAKALKRRVLGEKKQTGATTDVIAEVALEHFFSAYQQEQRLGFYRNHHYLPYGRKAA